MLSQRPDLPVDRIPAYLELERLQEQLAAQAGQEPVLFVSESCIEFLKTKRSFDMKLQISGHSYSFDADNIKLYAAPPAPTNAIAIVQSALEAAAKAVWTTTLTGRSCTEAETAIRAINPQTIIDAATKGQQ